MTRDVRMRRLQHPTKHSDDPQSLRPDLRAWWSSLEPTVAVVFVVAAQEAEALVPPSVRRRISARPQEGERRSVRRVESAREAVGVAVQSAAH